MSAGVFFFGVVRIRFLLVVRLPDSAGQQSPSKLGRASYNCPETLLDSGCISRLGKLSSHLRVFLPNQSSRIQCNTCRSRFAPRSTTPVVSFPHVWLPPVVSRHDHVYWLPLFFSVFVGTHTTCHERPKHTCTSSAPEALLGEISGWTEVMFHGSASWLDFGFSGPAV